MTTFNELKRLITFSGWSSGFCNQRLMGQEKY